MTLLGTDLNNFMKQDPELARLRLKLSIDRVNRYLSLLEKEQTIPASILGFEADLLKKRAINFRDSYCGKMFRHRITMWLWSKLPFLVNFTKGGREANRDFKQAIKLRKERSNAK